MKAYLRSTGVLLAFLMTTLPARAQIITTIAGNGTQGYGGDGGPATSAMLNAPEGVAADRSGNVYIADTYNQCIRKVAAGTGIITTVAPLGGHFGTATGVAADDSGNIYIADFDDSRIYKLSIATGITTIIAGGNIGTYSGDGGPAISAELNQPAKVAVDSAGNVYIADTHNHRIRKISVATGIITTVAGTGTAGFSGDGGPATSAQIAYPTGVAVDRLGNLYIAEYMNYRIRKITAGIISTICGTGVQGYSGDGGPAINAQISYPGGICLDNSGNIYIADPFNDRIRRIDAKTGIILTVAGSSLYPGFGGDGGLATSARLSAPNDVAVDGSGNMYIADEDNQRIRKITYSTAVSNISPAWPATLSVYPSPNTGYFTITANTGTANSSERVQISLINALGQCVYSREATPAGTQWSIPVQVGAGVASGMYQLRVSAGNASAVRSVVIQR